MNELIIIGWVFFVFWSLPRVFMALIGLIVMPKHIERVNLIVNREYYVTDASEKKKYVRKLLLVAVFPFMLLHKDFKVFHLDSKYE